MKTNDVFLAAYPKSGVTYLSYLLATARLHHNKLVIRPNFFNIDWLVIDESKMKGYDHSDFWKDGMGNFIKTHGLNKGQPSAIVLIREPFATLRSYYHFRKQLGNKETPQQFLSGPQGVNAWLDWVKSWTSGQVSQSLHFVDYGKLTKNTAEEVDRIFEKLGIVLEENAIEEALAFGELDVMRDAESRFVDSNPVYQKFNLEFVRPGEKREVSEFGEGLRAGIDARCKAAYEAVVSKLP